MIEESTLRILNSKGHTIGTGFLASKTLVVTCAHVVIRAGLDGENKLRVQFTGARQPISATALAQFEDLERDIAILKLEDAPDGIQPLRMGLAEHSRPGNTFRSFGYASAAELQGIFANGSIDGYQRQHNLVQLQSPQANHGMSGAPVWDEQRGVVIGIITKGHNELGRNENTTFATPAELIFKTCPEIQPDETCPYLGLESFSAETERFFFGRTALTEKLLTPLSRGCRFLAVFGPSGSGKSSVVRAGLLPALKKDRVPGSQHWAQIIIRPAEDPFAQLTAKGLDLSKIPETKTVLFIDQFEELFTCPDDIREHFVRELVAALEKPQLILVIAMRDDFYSAFNAKAAALAASPNKVVVDVPVTLERVDLVAMIEQPAAAVGLALEEGLTEAIIKDAAPDGTARSSSLPLLEFAMTQLWEKRREGLLTHDAYQSIGGVTGSLARWADEAYSDLPKAKQPLAESLLTALVHLGDEAQGLPDTRKRCALTDFDAPTHQVITHFANRRLLITSGDTVELVHDALVREWSRLQTWIKNDRDNLRLKEGISIAASQWEMSNKDKSLLIHRGTRLELALAISKLPKYRLNLNEQGYLSKCIDVRDREETLRRKLMISLAIGLVIAFITAGFALYQTFQAQEKARVSRARELASQAIAAYTVNPLLPYLLSIEAFKTKDILQSRSSLLNNIARNNDNDHSLINSFLRGHTGAVNSVAFNSDGNILASGSDDKTIILWDVAEGRPIGQPLTGHKDRVTSVVFNPGDKGKTLASGSYDGTIILWNVESHQPTAQLFTEDVQPILSIAFSPDGKTLAVGSNTGLILWNVTTKQLIDRPINAKTNSVAFSPDGKILAAGSFNKIILLDMTTHQPVSQLLTDKQTNHILSIAFSPDGKTLVTSSSYLALSKKYYSIILWNLATGQPIGRSIPSSTSSLALNSDGNLLVLSNSRAKPYAIKMLDIVTHSPFSDLMLDGHTDYINSLAFSSDGKTLASGSDDKKIILWDFDPQSWIKKTCQIVNRNFTQDEWIQYFPSEEYRLTCPQLPPGGELGATPTADPYLATATAVHP